MSTTLNRVVHRPPAAVVGWLVAIAFLGAGVALLARGEALVQERLAIDRLVLCLSASTVGAVVLLRRPGHGVGRICLAAGILAGLGILAIEFAWARSWLKKIKAKAKDMASQFQASHGKNAPGKDLPPPPAP